MRNRGVGPATTALTLRPNLQVTIGSVAPDVVPCTQVFERKQIVAQPTNPLLGQPTNVMGHMMSGDQNDDLYHVMGRLGGLSGC
jgi:hypothetical protein